MIETGNDLRKWRKDNNLTQQQVADFSGYSKDRIAHIETEDSPISKKLKRRIIQENAKLNPQKPLLLVTIEKFLTYNEERNHFFDKEIKPLEEKISIIFKNIPKGFEKTIDYLTLLDIWCDSFIKMINTPCDNQNDYNNNVNNILGRLRKNTKEYIIKYGNGKEN